MATQNWGIDLTFLAGEDLSSHQYRFVHLADDNTVDLVDSGTEYPIGILQNEPVSGEMAVVRVIGISKLVTNDAAAVGAVLKAEYVGATDNGKGEAADASVDIIRAIVLKATGAQDDIATVLLATGTQVTAS